MGHGFRSYVKLPDGIYVSLFILQTNINGHWQQQDLECWQLAAHKFTRPKCCQNIQNGLLSSSDVKWCNGIRTRDLDYSIWYWRNRTTPSTWLFNSTIQVQSGTIWNHLEPSGTIWNHLEPSGTIWNHLEPSGTSQTNLPNFGCRLSTELPLKSSSPCTALHRPGLRGLLRASCAWAAGCHGRGIKAIPKVVQIHSK